MAGSAAVERTRVQLRTPLGRGSFLTDGRRLLEVLDVTARGAVLVENCKHPDENPQWWTRHELQIARMEVVDRA